MTRGRYPEKAIARAVEIAKKRGLVRFYERGPGTLATFSILHPGRLDEVRIKRLRRIRCTLQGLMRDAADEIAGLRLFPSCPQISRELWTISPEYFLRFFRILDDSIIELGDAGDPLPAGSVLQGIGAPAPVRYLRRRQNRKAAAAKAGSRGCPTHGGSGGEEKSPLSSMTSDGLSNLVVEKSSLDSATSDRLSNLEDEKGSLNPSTVNSTSGSTPA
jgi:hypothetical protein